VARVPADEDHGEVHGAHGEHQVEEAEAVGDVVLLRLPLRLLELRVCLFGLSVVSWFILAVISWFVLQPK
jgi:hypothetical protein